MSAEMVGPLLSAEDLEELGLDHYQPVTDLLRHIGAQNATLAVQNGTMGAQADTIERLNAELREAAEQAEYWERTAAQIDTVLGAKIQRLADARREDVHRLAAIAVRQDRLLLGLLNGQDHGPALAAVNEARAALGWGPTEILPGSVPVVFRELVEALGEVAALERRAVREASEDDGDTALVAELFEAHGLALERVEAAWEAARPLVPEVAT